LNAAVVNSYILYKEPKPQKALKLPLFQKKLAFNFINPLVQKRLDNQ